MKNLSVFAATAALSLMFTACGDDSSSPSNVEREVESSSSVEESSSSVESSSSSVEENSNVPEGTRAATLEDLEKNYSLGKMFGTEVFLATGAKKGVFSLWVPNVAWIAFRSDFKDGLLEFGKTLKNSGYAGAEDAITDSLKAMIDNGTKIQLIVNEDKKLQYSLNGGDFQDMEVYTKVKTSENTLSDGLKLVGKSLKCTEGSETKTYSFYEGRYLVETADSWEAGYYDIQRSYLLMLPVFYPKSAYSLVVSSVTSDYNMVSLSDENVSCKSSDFKFESVSREELTGEWDASKDGYDWTLVLDKSGKYSVDGSKGKNSDVNNSGHWDVYGNLLLVSNESCLNPSKCLGAVKGVISDFDAEKGFNLDHTNTEEPIMPSAWSVPQYE